MKMNLETYDLETAAEQPAEMPVTVNRNTLKRHGNNKMHRSRVDTKKKQKLAASSRKINARKARKKG